MLRIIAVLIVVGIVAISAMAAYYGPDAPDNAILAFGAIALLTGWLFLFGLGVLLRRSQNTGVRWLGAIVWLILVLNIFSLVIILATEGLYG